MKHARERLSKGMVIYGGEMEIKRELLEFGRFVHEAVHDAFVYLAEVFNLVVFLKPFRFVHEYFKINIWVYLACSDYELYELRDRMLV